MKSIPTVQKYMTTAPHSIAADQTLATADKMMRDLKIRHLPVLKGGDLIGMISDRDLKLYQSMEGVNPKVEKAESIVDRDVYAVSPQAALDEVSAAMASKRLGSAVVMDNHKVVGIFTSVDAMSALSSLLQSRLKN